MINNKCLLLSSNNNSISSLDYYTFYVGWQNGHVRHGYFDEGEGSTGYRSRGSLNPNTFLSNTISTIWSHENGGSSIRFWNAPSNFGLDLYFYCYEYRLQAIFSRSSISDRTFSYTPNIFISMSNLGYPTSGSTIHFYLSNKLINDVEKPISSSNYNNWVQTQLSIYGQGNYEKWPN